MRLLIDGYNLMHAVVLPPGRRLAAHRLRSMRHRFLNDLATKLDVDLVEDTTIVFDSAGPPGGLPRQMRHLGIEVIFADPGEEADERIETLIARHSAPKRLTVVSTDHRVRLAARRRRATVQTSDEFWSALENRSRRARVPRPEPPALAADSRGPSEPSPDETAYWLNEFGHLDESTELRAASRAPDFIPSEGDLARIAREVEDESTWDR